MRTSSQCLIFFFLKQEVVGEAREGDEARKCERRAAALLARISERVAIDCTRVGSFLSGLRLSLLVHGRTLLRRLGDGCGLLLRRRRRLGG